jgi:hypothetical protein
MFLSVTGNTNSIGYSLSLGEGRGPGEGKENQGPSPVLVLLAAEIGLALLHEGRERFARRGLAQHLAE